MPKKNDNILPNVIHDEKKMIKVIDNILSYEKNVNLQIGGYHINKKFSVENISFSGITGEPLIAQKAITAAIRMIKNKGKRTGLFTNGLLIDINNCNILSRLDYINISIDAGTNQTYNTLKCGGRTSQKFELDKVYKNIALLNAAKKEFKTHLEINCSCILYPDNFNEIYLLASNLKKMGVSTLRLKKDIYGERMLNSQQKEMCLNLINKIKNDLEDNHFKLINIHDLDDDKEQEQDFEKCFISKMMAAVGSDGNLYPCNYHPKKGGYTLGSLIDIPFQTIWEARERKSLEEKLPGICPSVCDPFKTRSNKLFNKLLKIYEKEGISGISNIISEAEIYFGGNNK